MEWAIRVINLFFWDCGWMWQVIKRQKFIHLSILLVVVVLFPFFFLGGPDTKSNALFYAIWDCGHFVFFIGLVVAVNIFYPLNSPQRWLALSLAVFFGGGLIEIIQAHIGRDGNLYDVLRDLTGTWLGLFFLQPASLLIWIFRALSLLLLIPSLWAVAVGASIEWQKYRDFPIIDGFEYQSEVHRWRGHIELSNAFFSQGKQSLLVHLNTKPFSGISLKYYVGDWRGYSALAVDIYNPNEAMQLSLRVNDLIHQRGKNNFNDRFNQKIALQNGWNAIEIPMGSIENAPSGRKMRLDQIVGVEFFVSQLSQPRIIYIDNLRLK